MFDVNVEENENSIQLVVEKLLSTAINDANEKQENNESSDNTPSVSVSNNNPQDEIIESKEDLENISEEDENNSVESDPITEINNNNVVDNTTNNNEEYTTELKEIIEYYSNNIQRGLDRLETAPDVEKPLIQNGIERSQSILNEITSDNVSQETITRYIEEYKQAQKDLIQIREYQQNIQNNNISENVEDKEIIPDIDNEDIELDDESTDVIDNEEIKDINDDSGDISIIENSVEDTNNEILDSPEQTTEKNVDKTSPMQEKLNEYLENAASAIKSQSEEIDSNNERQNLDDMFDAGKKTDIIDEEVQEDEQPDEAIDEEVQEDEQPDETIDDAEETIIDTDDQQFDNIANDDIELETIPISEARSSSENINNNLSGLQKTIEKNSGQRLEDNTMDGNLADSYPPDTEPGMGEGDKRDSFDESATVRDPAYLFRVSAWERLRGSIAINI